MHLMVKVTPGIPVYESIFFRSLYSFIVAGAVLWKLKISPFGNNKPLLVLRGLVGMISLLCFFYAIQHMPLASAVTISNLTPMFALVLAMIFLNEKITGWHWLFFVLSFIGVLVIKGFDSRIQTFDMIVAIGASFFTACAHFIVRKLRDTDHAQVIIFYFPLVTLPLIGPYTLMHWVNPTPKEWLNLFLIGTFTHIGQIYLTKAYQHANISAVSNVYYIGIILSLLYGWIFFAEVFNIWTYIGMALILSGVLMNVRKNVRQ